MELRRRKNQLVSWVCIPLMLTLLGNVLGRGGSNRGGVPGGPAQVERGRTAYGQACVQCHSPARTVMQRKAAEAWKATFSRMISRGAPVMPDEIEDLTAYLAASYGPDSPAPVLDQAAGENHPLPQGEGRTILVSTCGSCHAVGW